MEAANLFYKDALTLVVFSGIKPDVCPGLDDKDLSSMQFSDVLPLLSFARKDFALRGASSFRQKG
jgi:hypothetical protein